MNNSIILFRFYLIIIFLLLFIFSMILSKGLFRLIIKGFKITFLSSLSCEKFSQESYLLLYKFYLDRGDFFLCISLSEMILDYCSEFIRKDIIYFCLASAYSRITLLHISEYYYLKALTVSPCNCDIMFALSKMYYDIGFMSKAKNICNSIKNIDPCYDLSLLVFS